MDMQLNALTTSNISDKETKQNKNVVAGKKNSKKDFSLFLLGENQVKNKNQDFLKGLEKEWSKKIFQNSKSLKSDEENLDVDAFAFAGAKEFDIKEFGKDFETKTTGGQDFGNGIDGSKLKGRNSGTTLDNLKDVDFVVEKNNKTQNKIDGKFDFLKSEQMKDSKSIENAMQNIKLKNTDLKNELSGLYENKKKDAVDTGLKFKEIAGNKEIIVTKGKSPQSKGRIYIGNEDKNFVKNNSAKNSEVSTSEVRKVDNDLKMVGRASYGLKKFKGVNSLSEEDKKPLAYGSVVSTANLKTSDNFASQFLRESNLNSARTDFENIVEQVQNGIKMHFNSQLKEMKIKLQPEELGEVEVKLRIENNIMKAEFIVENQQVKEALESKFDSLKNNLSEKGFQGSEIDVYVSTGDRNKKETQEKFDFLADKKSGKVRNSVSKSNALNSIDKQSVRRRGVMKDSSLDIFV